MHLRGWLGTAQARLGVTFLLQLGAMGVAVLSVEAAGWLETPPLVLVVLLATVLAAALASRPKAKPVHHLVALVAGLGVAYLSGVFLAEGGGLLGHFDDLHTRFASWWAAVTGEDATTDTMPLAMALVAITWLAAYFSAWAVFRYRNAWFTVVPIGGATLINLTYLEDTFYVYLFGFLFFGLLLLVHLTSVNRWARLQEMDTPHPASFHRLSLAHGLLLTVAVLAVSAMVPVGESPARPLKPMFRPVDQFVEDLRVDMHRIFAAVPGHDLPSMRFFGPVLPLLRPVPTGDDPVLFADVRFPLYWPAVAYDEYTSKAWRVRDTEEKLVTSFDTQQADIGEEGEESTVPSESSVSYKVQMFVDSPYLMVASEPLHVDPGARQQIPAAERFHIDLQVAERNADLPVDLQTLFRLATEDGVVELGDIPTDLFVTKVIKESDSGSESAIEIETGVPSYYPDLRRALEGAGRTVGLDVTRSPLGQSAISFKPMKPLGENGVYRVLATMNLASESRLRGSSGEYPPQVVSRYLQIPDTLPDRVGSLALELTAGLATPYDQSQAIEAYLRTLTYSTVSPDLPHDAEVVDHFLFESGEGYSDYFASAMAVMLRTLGIPTRLVLGFGPGTEETEKQGFFVRDKDSHSWPEVYFNDLGWIPFEPTPIYDLRVRGPLESAFGYGGLALGLASEEEQLVEGGPPVIDLGEEPRDDQGGPLPGGQGLRAFPERYFGTPLGRGGLLFGLFLLTGALLTWLLWLRQYGRLQGAETAYVKMRRLASFLGIPSPVAETPFEFARELSQAVPGVKGEVDLVCQTFVRQRFGGINPSPTEELRLVWAWRRIKRAFVAQARWQEEPGGSTV